MDEVLACENSRVKFFPIMMYAMVMGMSLTIMYQKAALFLSFNEMIGTLLMAFSTMLFVVISLSTLRNSSNTLLAFKKSFHIRSDSIFLRQFRFQC